MAEDKSGASAGAGTVTLSADQLKGLVATAVEAGVSAALKANRPASWDEAERQRETERAQAEAKKACKPYDDIVAAGSKAYLTPIKLTLMSHQVWHDGERKLRKFGDVVHTRFGDAWGRKHIFNEADRLEATAAALRERHARECHAFLKRERPGEPVPVEVALGLRGWPDDPKKYPPMQHWTDPKNLE